MRFSSPGRHASGPPADDIRSALQHAADTIHHLPACVPARRRSAHARLFDGIGRPEALRDPRFATHVARPAHIDAPDALIEEHVRRLTLDEALRFFAERDITAGAVCCVADLLRHPYAQERGLLVEQPTPDGRRLPVHAVPYRIDGRRPPIRRPAPAPAGGTPTAAGRRRHLRR